MTTPLLGKACGEQRHECCVEVAQCHVYLDECYVNSLVEAAPTALVDRIAGVVRLLTECRAENREGFAMLRKMGYLLTNAVPMNCFPASERLAWHERVDAVLERLGELP